MQVERFWYANESNTIPTVWHYSSGVFSLLCLLLGLVANGLVIFVFIRNDNLRRPRNYYLINLALTDVGLLVSNNSMHVISSFKKYWIFGQIGCDIYSVCGGIFGLTSIATMAAISLTRLAAVNDPLSSLKMSSRFTISCQIGTWIYGSIWIIPPLFGWNRFILEGFGTSCTFDYISQNRWDQIFTFMLITGGFLVPLTIILLSYALILIRLSQRNRRFLSQMIETHSTSQHDPTYFLNKKNHIDQRERNPTLVTLDGLTEDNPIADNMRRQEARATRTAFLICALFCLAWGPYALMALISLFGFNYLVNAYTTALLGMFTKVAACINPMLYALSLNGFQEQICSYMKCLFQCDAEQKRQLTPLKIHFHQKKLLNTQSSY